ncbi:hypothetical protein [Actinokineospora sp. NBRC 105648]|uniref:hypothetical protein n=1 Tax=Actinokineospora sp. NBRC 105648 TaxID=3032206 RepID=UPI0024A50156|nr:hypothetical protein [Actinokineospora sp. NBRC 105648]GLZ43505.1 hypothetical protein Acsp05_71290 [Actinokineospora sp. NBRC 105648]
MTAKVPRKNPGTKIPPPPPLTPRVEDLNVGKEPAPTAGRPRAGSEDQPRYQQMIRGESRLRPDQVTDLAALRREVARNRRNNGERITDNTLLRLAVDLLIANAHKLVGDTEDELRVSLLDTKQNP